MANNSGESRERQTSYETAVIQSFGLEVKVSVELRETYTVPGLYERTGNWFSCVTDLKEGHILGGQTTGSGNTEDSPFDLAESIWKERLKRGRIQ